MSWLDWISLSLGTVQALATVVAVYFAWRAVEEASGARREAIRDARLARLERMAVTVAEAKRAYDSGNMIERARQVERLNALLRSTPGVALPKTRAYAGRDPAVPFPDQEYRQIADEASDELEKAAD